METSLHWGTLARTHLVRLGGRLSEERQAWMEGAEPDSLRKLRVLVRRTRIAMRIFRPSLAPRWAQGLSGQLKELGRVLARGRERDVFRFRLEAYMLDLELRATFRRQMLQIVDLGCDRAVSKAQEALQDKDFDDLLEQLSDPHLDGLANVNIAPAAPGLLWQAAKPIHRFRKESLLSHSDRQRHQLRLRLKRLRYTVELLQPALQQDFSENLNALKRLQAQLGELEDLGNAMEQLDELSSAKDLDARSRFELGEIQELISLDRQEQLRRLEALWMAHRSLWKDFKVEA